MESIKQDIDKCLDGLGGLFTRDSRNSGEDAIASAQAINHLDGIEALTGALSLTPAPPPALTPVAALPNINDDDVKRRGKEAYMLWLHLKDGSNCTTVEESLRLACLVMFDDSAELYEEANKHLNRYMEVQNKVATGLAVKLTGNGIMQEVLTFLTNDVAGTAIAEAKAFVEATREVSEELIASIIAEEASSELSKAKKAAKKAAAQKAKAAARAIAEKEAAEKKAAEAKAIAEQAAAAEKAKAEAEAKEAAERAKAEAAARKARHEEAEAARKAAAREAAAREAVARAARQETAARETAAAKSTKAPKISAEEARKAHEEQLKRAREQAEQQKKFLAKADNMSDRRGDKMTELRRQKALEEQRQKALEEQRRQKAIDEQRQKALEEQRKIAKMKEDQRKKTIEDQRRQKQLKEDHETQAAIKLVNEFEENERRKTEQLEAERHERENCGVCFEPYGSGMKQRMACHCDKSVRECTMCLGCLLVMAERTEPRCMCGRDKVVFREWRTK